MALPSTGRHRVVIVGSGFSQATTRDFHGRTFAVPQGCLTWNGPLKPPKSSMISACLQRKSHGWPH